MTGDSAGPPGPAYRGAVRRLLGLLIASVLLVPVGGGAAHARVEPMPRGTDGDYQLGGEDSVPSHVGIVARDRTESPVNAKYNVCYVNGFQTQPNEKRFWQHHSHRDLVLRKNGRPVVDENWGEWLLDIRTPAKRKRLASIMGRWIAGCAAHGFQAVEFDNLDSYTRSRWLLHREDAVAFARLLVREAHEAGLAAAQKNLADLDGTRLGFDLAVVESCAEFAECWRYVHYYGSQVLMVEYRRADFDKGCKRYGRTHPVVLRDLDLSPSYTPRFC